MMGDGIGYTMGYGSSWIFWILCLILIVWLYSVIINNHDKKNTRDRKSSTNRKTPIEILEQRYSEGKIDKNEYKKRLAHMHRDVMP